MLADPRPAPLVLLEDPRTMGNMGACVRVAAAADAAGVLTHGRQRPLAPRRPARGRRPALRAAGGGDRRRCPAERAARWSRSTPAARSCGPPSSAAAGDPRLRHRAPRAQRGAARARRRAARDPDAGGRLEPQPRDLGRRRAFLGEALNLGCGRYRNPGQMGTTPNSPADGGGDWPRPARSSQSLRWPLRARAADHGLGGRRRRPRAARRR